MWIIVGGWNSLFFYIIVRGYVDYCGRLEFFFLLYYCARLCGLLWAVGILFCFILLCAVKRIIVGGWNSFFFYIIVGGYDDYGGGLELYVFLYDSARLYDE